MIKGIITGDIVNSTKIPERWRSDVLYALEDVVRDFRPTTYVGLEMFRGDSFQMMVDDARMALSVAIALRTRLKMATPEYNDTWDARVAIGLGDVSYESSSIVTSDGEAFRLSGRAFDMLGKRRLAIASFWGDREKDLDLNTRFADDIITSWSPKKAYVVHAEIITGLSQKGLSAHLGMSPQNINYIWTSARCSLILEYIERYKEIVSKYIYM